MVNAADVFRLVAETNWDYAEPEFLESHQSGTPTPMNFSFAGVNPCAEEPLPAGGSRASSAASTWQTS